MDNINPAHYTDLAITPLEYIEANNLSWCEANVVKYISRHKKKNGLEDLKKAQWYLTHLIEQHEDYEPRLVKIAGSDFTVEEAVQLFERAEDAVTTTPEESSEAAEEEVGSLQISDPLGGAPKWKNLEFFAGRDPLRECTCDFPEERPSGHTYSGYCNKCGYRINKLSLGKEALRGI